MYNVVGKSVLKNDVVDKVLGVSKYAADLKMDGMLYAKILRSKVPHGILKSIDISKALQLSGVHSVVTSKDIEGENSYGIVVKDEPVFTNIGDRFRKVGEAFAAVAAETPEIAEKALELIEVEIEELPAITNVFDAMKENAVKLHKNGNIFSVRKIRKGNMEAFSNCAHIVEGEYTTHMVDHSSIEPESGIAKLEGEILTIWCSSQNVHYDQKDVARALKLPLHKTRVVQATTGGGFGGKLDISVQIHLGLLALKTKKPVKMVYSREEHMFCSPKRHPYIIKMKTGVDEAGKLLAHECIIYGDTGAYSSYGPAVLTRAAIHATGPYKIDNVYADAYTVFTNNPTAGAMRGFGVPQITFAMENQMDKLAEKANISQYEIRHINGIRNGDATATGQVLEKGVGFLETLEKAKAKADEIMKRPENTNKKYGVGISCMKYGIGNTGLPNPAGAFVELYDDGTALVLTGCADIGQGSDTTLAQIAAEELGLNFEDVRVISADTEKTPEAGATSASRQTYISGNAVRLASKQAKENVLVMAAAELDVRVEDLAVKNKKVYVKDLPDKEISLVECVQKCRGKGILTQGSGWFNPDTIGLDLATGEGKPYATFAYATQIADVLVDEETGEVEVLNIVAAHDVGTAINPKNVEGQIEGGISFGLGYATFEELKVENSVIKTPNFATYLLATTMDIPNIYPIIVESEEETGPFGAKGVGEPTLIPTASAIANAINNATGKKFNSLPISIEKLQSKKY